MDEAQLMSEFGFDKWLAYVYDNLKGVRVVLAGSQIGLLEELIEKGREILKDEVENFLEHVKNKEGYIRIMEALAFGIKKWGKIKDFLRAKGVKVSDGFITKAIKKLKDYSFVDEKLEITDPLLRELLRGSL